MTPYLYQNSLNKYIGDRALTKILRLLERATFQKLKKNALDSVKSIDEKLKIESQKSLQDLNKKLIIVAKIRLEQDLELSKAILEKNTISFVGLKLKKNTFKIIIWSIFLSIDYPHLLFSI